MILSGILVRDKIEKKLKAKIAKSKTKPTLAVIQVGNRSDSNSYIKQKIKFADSIGAKVIYKKFPVKTNLSKIISEIKKYNNDKKIHGIIIQLPLPKHLDPLAVASLVDPKKDVDGLSPENTVSKKFVPATAKGILTLLNYYKIPIVGKKVVVVGRSRLVGKPIADLFLAENATVTVCHSKTKNLPRETRQADVLIVATGVPNLIGKKHVKSGQVVVDVGINPLRASGRLRRPTSNGKGLLEEIPNVHFVGDVDFAAVKRLVKAISPVPGGVGPMTVASLFENLCQAASV